MIVTDYSGISCTELSSARLALLISCGPENPLDILEGWVTCLLPGNMLSTLSSFNFVSPWLLMELRAFLLLISTALSNYILVSSSSAVKSLMTLFCSSMVLRVLLMFSSWLFLSSTNFFFYVSKYCSFSSVSIILSFNWVSTTFEIVLIWFTIKSLSYVGLIYERKTVVKDLICVIS